MMYKTCRHIRPNGLPCESPALKGALFCYYHSKIHTIGAEPYAKYGPMQLPTPEDPAAVQLSVARISDAIINGRLDLKKAASLLYGLQIAAQFIDRKQFFYAPNVVQSAEQNAQGDELAPSEYICDDEDECKDCPYSDECDRCIRPGDETPGDSDDDDDDDDEDE
jgi:hypothetical protein